mgnify:FL=1
MSKVDIKQFVSEVAQDFNVNYATGDFKFNLDEHGLKCFFDEILPLMDFYKEISSTHEDKYFEVLFQYTNQYYCLTGCYSSYDGRQYDIWCSLEKGKILEKQEITYIFKGE